MNPCENGIPSGVVYYGKMTTMVDGSDTSDVQFRISGQGATIYHVDWMNSSQVWPPCSDVTLTTNSTGRMYLSQAWLNANSVGVVSLDPKIPLSLPITSKPQDYFGIEVQVTSVEITFALAADLKRVGRTVISDSDQTLPRAARPDQVALEEGAVGTLFLSEDELAENGFADLKDEAELVTWPDPAGDARALVDEGLVKVQNGSIAFTPKSEADIHRLSGTLLALSRMGIRLSDALERS